MMKIGIIGANGKAGSLIMNEALERGHEVTAIVRNPEKLQNDNVTIIQKDIFDLKTDDLDSFDVLVNAFNAKFGEEYLHTTSGEVLIRELSGLPNTRLVVVGSGGSLFSDEKRDERIHETAGFPQQFMDTALQMQKNLEDLENTDDVNWVYISPSGLFDAEGERTGKYETGTDVVLTNSTGESYTSYADFAVALMDEVEYPKHHNERFAVVSESE